MRIAIVPTSALALSCALASACSAPGDAPAEATASSAQALTNLLGDPDFEGQVAASPSSPWLAGGTAWMVPEHRGARLPVRRHVADRLGGLALRLGGPHQRDERPARADAGAQLVHPCGVHGRDTNAPEQAVEWKLEDYRGDTVRLMIEDENAVGPWGFIGTSAFTLE